MGEKAATCEVGSPAGLAGQAASLLDWAPAVKGDDKQKVVQVLFETVEGDNLGHTGSFLKKKKKKKKKHLSLDK